MSIKLVCGNCGVASEVPPTPTFQQQTHDYLAAINAAAPNDLQAMSKELVEMAKNPASRINMRLTYASLAQTLKKASK